VVLDLWFRDTHPVQLPFDVVPAKRQRFRGCPKPTVATQSQDHLPDGVGLLHQLVDHFARHELVDLHRALLRLYFAERVFVDDLPVDRIVHELASELDPFVDRRRGHPSGFELLVKLFRVACRDLIDPDPLGHELFEVRNYLLPNRDGGWLATLAMAFDVAI